MKPHSFLSVLVCLISINASAQTYSYDLEADLQGWQPDFADYPAGDSVLYALNAYHAQLPAPIVPVQYGVFMEGNNFSDDLFLFIKKQITGLMPFTAYEVAFHIDVATDESIYMIGGSDLMMKAGVTVTEPLKVQDSMGMMRMNIDKGNQWGPGTDMDSIGVVRHGFNDTLYHLFTLSNTGHPFHFTTDATGNVWLIAGAESAFEVYAKLYIAELEFVFSPVASVKENEITELHIYPNPATESVIISGNEAESIIIYNMIGEKMLSVPAQKEINVASLAPGTYWAEVQSKGRILRQKFIRQ